MTHNWNQIFEHALQVDGPLRSDILRELHEHQQEAKSTVLADPQKLAFAYNRTHLGFFCSVPRLLLLPLFLWLLLIAASGIISLSAEAWIPPTIIMLAFVSVVIIMGIRSLAHMQSPLRALFAMMPVFILSCSLFVFIVVVPESMVNHEGSTFQEALTTDGLPVFMNWLPISFFSVFIPLTAVTLFWRLHRMRRKKPAQQPPLPLHSA